MREGGQQTKIIAKVIQTSSVTAKWSVIALTSGRGCRSAQRPKRENGCHDLLSVHLGLQLRSGWTLPSTRNSGSSIVLCFSQKHTGKPRKGRATSFIQEEFGPHCAIVICMLEIRKLEPKAEFGDRKLTASFTRRTSLGHLPREA